MFLLREWEINPRKTSKIQLGFEPKIFWILVRHSLTIKSLHKQREEEKAPRKYFTNNNSLQLEQKQFSSSCLKLKNCQEHLICILQLLVKVKGKIEILMVRVISLIMPFLSTPQNCKVTRVWVSTGNVRWQAYVCGEHILRLLTEQGRYLRPLSNALFKVLLCSKSFCFVLKFLKLISFAKDTEHLTCDLLCNVMPTMCSFVLLCTPATLLSC